jgi:single-strand DNA-binding protein
VTDLARRRLADGGEAVGFRVLSTERRFDKRVGEWVDGREFAVWVNCWRRLAANVAAALRKGDHVMVSGKLFTTGGVSDGDAPKVELEAFAVGPNLARAPMPARRTHGAARAEGMPDADAA